MKLLVIPDIHLRTWMLKAAEEAAKENNVDGFVFLGDFVDDFGKENDLEAYRETLDTVIQFAKDHPNTYWCWGNHDTSYLWYKNQSGFSFHAFWLVKEKLQELIQTVPEDRLKFVHRIDNTLFMHGGLSKYFVEVVEERVGQTLEVDELVEVINAQGETAMWTDSSPIWHRPQDAHPVWKYEPAGFVQVVGHTPVEKIYQEGGVISCDTFSTYRDGTPYGDRTFLLIDTETMEWKAIHSAEIVVSEEES